MSAIRGLDKLTKTEMIFPTTAISRLFKSLWRLWGQTSSIDKLELNIYHGLSNELPLNIKKANCKSIVTIHDLIFLVHPECYKPIDRLIYNYKFRKACENADHIIAVSECTKRDIVKFYGINSDKIDIVYQGCDKQFSIVCPTEEKDQIRDKYKLPKRYILYLGSIEERKNLMLLAKALKLLPSEFEVVAVGKKTTYADSIDKFLKDNGLTERMRMISGIPFNELPAFYQSAEMFVYPSRYEGFGIPILEALNSGIPVIAATGSCLEEAGGEHSIYVNPDDEIEMAEAIKEIRYNEALRKLMIEEGRKHAKLFEETAIRNSLMNIYKKVIRKK